MNILEDLKNQYKTGGIVQKIIFLNVTIFVLSLLFFYSFEEQGFQYPKWLALSLGETLFFKFWTLITYAFLHSSFIHLVFNMLVLYFSGRLFLSYFTGRQFLGLYLLGGIFSGLVFLVVYSFFKDTAFLVGASGSIMAVLIAVATYAPYQEVQLSLIGKIKLWQLAAVLLILVLIQIPLENTGGHISHLGGALFGFLFVKMLYRGQDVTKIISVIQDQLERLVVPSKKKPFKKVHRNKASFDVKGAKEVINTEKNTIDQRKIDDILDRISKSGYDSLTKEEKEFLFKVGR